MIAQIETERHFGWSIDSRAQRDMDRMMNVVFGPLPPVRLPVGYDSGPMFGTPPPLPEGGCCYAY